MSEIYGISGVADQSALNQSSARVAGDGTMDRDTFLTLLTTQLQNQDPTSPMDNQEFVAQLAQFTSLEQQMQMVNAMEAVYMGIASMNNATMAGLVGTEVVASGNEFLYDGESDAVELHYDSAGEASTATVSIYDANGHIVYSEELSSLEAGEGTFTWDGRDSSGETVEEGTYTFRITAQDSTEDSVEVSELIVGTVTAMDYSSGTPQPSVEGVSIDLGDILRLTAAVEEEEGA
jgi:flagellar basal-body rod modification protein FlgD